MYKYDQTFYDYINKGAISSAQVILPILLRYFSVNSVVDFGCGQGAWLSVWKQQGVNEIAGVDGSYVRDDSLLINENEFFTCDLSKPINLDKQFDLVQSLEVAEHIPESSAEIFIDSLVAHGKIIFFSAAAKGQGGENHINEQPYEYWRDIFHKRGYILFDLVRPFAKDNPDVEPWYKYNSFIYIDKNMIDTLAPGLADFRIAEDLPIPDVSPIFYKFRKSLLRLLPLTFKTFLATLKKKYVVASRN